jgi:isopentenyl-diphosphate delta-isomerase type 1
MADNPDEIFDVVDGSDRVVGTARRGDVHANGWLHRAVHVMVCRENGDVFVQKRSMGKDSYPGRWDSSSSGHLDSGESYDAAAERELEEELGITPGNVVQIGSLTASKETGNEFVKIYKATSEGPFVLHPDEIAEGKWVSVSSLRKWIHETPEDFAPCFVTVWDSVSKDFG